MRRVRSILAPLTLLLVVGCGGDPPPEADAVVAPAELARALADDRAAALAAWEGSTLSLTGTVAEKIRPGGLNPTLGVRFGEIDERLAFDSGLSFVSFDPEDGAARSEFEALAVGATVTLHCRLERLSPDGTLLKVGSCRVIS